MADLRVAVAKGTFAGFETGERRIGEHVVALEIVPMESVEQIAQHTDAADGVLIGLQRLGPAELATLGERVRAISRAGIGLDSIDLEGARTRGIAVIHQPDYATLEVATHAVALILAVSRKLTVADRIARSGWKGRRALSGIRPLDTQTIGVVGAGAIGRAVIARILPLAGRVLVHDPYAQELPAGCERCDDLDALLAQSDILTLHAPLIEATRNMIGARELAVLPEGAMLVNVARGELVDRDAFVAALGSGHLAGAGLDVFANEPFAADDPLTRFENVILTPHIGFTSTRAVEKLQKQSLMDLFAFLVEGRVYGGRLAVSP